MTMSPGADLFVVCQQCGSEVSPYITECPYCGNRLRRRAPKLPRDTVVGTSRRARLPGPALGRLRRGEIPGIRADSPPYVTAALVLVTCAVWVAWRGDFVKYGKLVIVGPLHGQWWRLLTTQFAYPSGFYQFATLVAVALFGWLLERRYGPIVVLALFFAAGVTGALAEVALYAFPLAAGGNGAALGLLAAWAVPDVMARRRRAYYDGDLLGTAAIAATLLAMPLARVDASWVAGVVGALVGLLVGAGLARMNPR
jgi:membrane associated rhomboid family serine protease